MWPVQDVETLLARKSELAAQSLGDPEFASRLRSLRSWQAARLAHTYSDLQREPRYAPAVAFFLTDLYGPQQDTTRDRDIVRAWQYLKHTLPAPALEVLGYLIALEVLMAELDHAMIAALPPGTLTGAAYAKAYRSVGRPEARQRQIDLVLGAGESFDRIVAHPWIGVLLLAARGPAQAAGFGVLQDFLERGYEAFRRMGGAQRLLDAIRQRETTLMTALFAGSDAELESSLRPEGGTG